ncbi:MAG: CehA/McbA family metallohydrolase [Planctomycetes bacterium]|nr:CehA/McbA family metallohydrolase [Planctomycetota bacterium]
MSLTFLSRRRYVRSAPWVAAMLWRLASSSAVADEPSVVGVEGQPLAANVRRLAQAFDFLGSPLPRDLAAPLDAAAKEMDAERLQQLLDPQAAFIVTIDSSGATTERGPADIVLQQAGFTPQLVKVVNRARAARPLRIFSPQSGPVYGGVAELSMRRQQQEGLRVGENRGGGTGRFLQLEMYTASPMTARLSGLAVEYVIALAYSGEAGRRKAEIGFGLEAERDAAGGAESIVVDFDVRPAVPVKLRVRDFDGRPTVARLLIRDAHGRVYPPQPKRLAPDFFFQPHIYREDGARVLLPPGAFTIQSSRGPEYRVGEQQLVVSPEGEQTLDVQLKRWVEPQAHGFYSGDHHIHAAGCAHYAVPTQGVTPQDMFLQVKGEGLNVGCVLTWGPCYDHQRTFFAPTADEVSEPLTLLKYDLEISGFGSQALGHVCLLNLKDQTYPGSEGTATKGWPTWTTPVMRWAKEQGGIAGYAHSASGLHIDPQAAARRLIEAGDRDGDRRLDARETASVLLPEALATSDKSGDGRLSEEELVASHDRAADRLPNLAVPEMNGVGAMEICVSTAEGVCDFISAMDTARIQEWNTWYHILNCGFPLKVSGETDFPCMSSRNVGQGRVYVRLDDHPLDFDSWCEGLAAGRSYVSDGYAHALEFEVDGKRPGASDVQLDEPGEVTVEAEVAFAPETPRAVAHGTLEPPGGRRLLGDTVLLHFPRSEETVRGGERLVEIVVNGRPVASETVPADGAVHKLRFTIPIDRSSWVALRHFPQLHTNPVNVIVDEKPIRASRDSARWCVAMTELLWKNREERIAPAERDAARASFERALAVYRRIAKESPGAD